MRTALYKPLGLAAGIAGGVLAGALFRRVWQVASDKEAPDILDPDRGWQEVLAAAAVQGLIFAVVKAAVERGGAQGFAYLTGKWPR